MKKNRFKFSFYLIIAVVSLAAVNSASGENSGYKSENKRDPFVPLVGISQESTASGIAGILSIEDVNFQGILLDSDGNRNVIINGEMLKNGEGENLFFVEEIGENIVRVRIGQEKHELLLYE